MSIERKHLGRLEAWKTGKPYLNTTINRKPEPGLVNDALDPVTNIFSWGLAGGFLAEICATLLYLSGNNRAGTAMMVTGFIFGFGSASVIQDNRRRTSTLTRR